MYIVPKDYFKKNPDYEYTVAFNERKHSVSICLCKGGKRYIPEATDDIIGILVILLYICNEISYEYF